MPTKIQMSDVKVQGDTVLVQGKAGNALANSLVQKHSVTIGELGGKFGFIDPSSISIGQDGSVQIADAKLAAKVNQMADSNKGTGGGSDPGFFDTNCSCTK